MIRPLAFLGVFVLVSGVTIAQSEPETPPKLTQWECWGYLECEDGTNSHEEPQSWVADGKEEAYSKLEANQRKEWDDMGLCCEDGSLPTFFRQGAEVVDPEAPSAHRSLTATCTWKVRLSYRYSHDNERHGAEGRGASYWEAYRNARAMCCEQTATFGAICCCTGNCKFKRPCSDCWQQCCSSCSVRKKHTWRR